MSLLQRILPVPSSYDRPPHATMSTTSTSTTSTPRFDPAGLPLAARTAPRKRSPLLHLAQVDLFLSQYIKLPAANARLAQLLPAAPAPFLPAFSLSKHQLYFRLINKQRRLKLLEVYHKYLINHEPHEHEAHHTLRTVYDRKSLDLDLQKTPRVSVVLPPTHRHRVPTKIVLPPLVPSPPLPLHLRRVQKLPAQFMHCPIDDLIVLILRMLQLLISLNDKLVPELIANPFYDANDAENKKVLTRYHLRTPPAISTHTYLTRLTKFNNFTPATLLTTIYYIDLLLHHYQPFFTLNLWTVHRFLLVSTMLSQKLMEDFFFTNDHYAKVGGVAVTELNCLELDFLHRVDWRLVPAKQLLENGSPARSSIKYSREVLDLYYQQLIQLMGPNVASGPDEPIYVNESDDMEEDEDLDEDLDGSRDGSRDGSKSRDPAPPPGFYDERGFSVDGTSSPHLKRRYSAFSEH